MTSLSSLDSRIRRKNRVIHSAGDVNIMTRQASPDRNPTSGTQRRQVRLREKLLMVLAAAFFGLLLCEVVLRLMGYSFPPFYKMDGITGAALRPNAEGWWTREGRSYIRINSQGLRDREHTKVKPANTVRIAVLGDSFSEAFQLPMENAFWAVAEAKLQACHAMRGHTVEAINFGVSGYGTAQELLTLRSKVWDYDPDIVLLAMTTRNDVGDNSRVFKQSDDIPYFVLSNGRLLLDDSFRHTRMYRLRGSTLYDAVRWVRARSRVVQAVNGAAYAVSVWLQRRSDQGRSSRLADYQEPRDPAWRDAWAVTEALIVLMRDEVEEKHAKFFVVTLTGPVQIDPDPKVRQEAMRKSDINDFFYPDLRVKALGERESIPVLVLAPGMQSFAERNRVHLHGFGHFLGGGHWNELGHRVAGERISDWLCERLTSGPDARR